MWAGIFIRDFHRGWGLARWMYCGAKDYRKVNMWVGESSAVYRFSMYMHRLKYLELVSMQLMICIYNGDARGVTSGCK